MIEGHSHLGVAVRGAQKGAVGWAGPDALGRHLEEVFLDAVEPLSLGAFDRGVVMVPVLAGTRLREVEAAAENTSLAAAAEETREAHVARDARPVPHQ